MKKPIVAIVGRPNVGKSTLFNRMAGKRRAVIEDIPGITRDRLYDEAVIEGKRCILIDTGGIVDNPHEEIETAVKEQALAAVDEADILIMMMDAESGLIPSDTGLINLLRRFGKKTFHVVNKVDGINKEKKLMPDFYSAGLDILPISALNGYGCAELMEKIAELLPEAGEKEPQYPRISILGRPNVGKSTLVNSLLGKNRMIVSDVPGTTRDSVDSVCSYYGRNYILVDTAGIRKKGRMAETFEKYSFMRTVSNVENCDVALLVLDASEGVVELDLKIAGLVHGSGRGAIIIMNKWDRVEKDELSMKKTENEIYRSLWFMKHVPILTVSALSRQRVTKIFSLVDEVMAEGSKKISTHQLNLFIQKVTSMKEPPVHRGKRVKIKYMTQVKTGPPAFIIFTNDKEGVRPQYLSFIEKQLREAFGFRGVPLNLVVREGGTRRKR
ncbi:MAG: ribosome biogenesis GTPase Der [Nitrospirae bacterium]|nr:ribosome biogenesis GTPase Der [Nitrospirota bacterium]